MIEIPEIAPKLLFAIFVGGLIGAEREFHDKAAGFRTITFICFGSTLFTILSIELSGNLHDPARIAANIVSGVGFIGAGVILRNGGHIIGLTTASTIWIAAALGMSIGGGYYLITGIATIVILIYLWFFPVFDRWIHIMRKTRTYHVVFPANKEKFHQLESLIHECGLKVEYCNRSIASGEMACTWRLNGLPKNHEQLADKLFVDGNLIDFSY
jgi:putative Mg2+ transporter-C (MgtC) family protein